MNSAAVVLITSKVTKSLHANIENNYKTYHLWEQPDQQAFLEQHGHEITAVATSAVYGASATLMSALPNLKIVVSYGVGYDALDINYAKQHGICVTNTPDVLNDCVADTALALLLDVARYISYSDRFIRSGQWKSRSVRLGHKIGNKTCGIVGLGRIGKAIAKRAEAFDMKIAYYGRNQQLDVNYDYYNDLQALAKVSDFLVLALPATNETNHIINEQVLAALGAKGFLINIARGSVVDEQALVKALQQGVIAGAGLDVFEHEPNTPKELWEMDNVVMTPHIGSSTYETREAMSDLVFANLTSFLEGKGAITPVV